MLTFISRISDLDPSFAVLFLLALTLSLVVRFIMGRHDERREGEEATMVHCLVGKGDTKEKTEEHGGFPDP